ncbi:MAG TPA: tRNA uridine-5-carboxymethylaminomethyl(34) synthesis GTPase MnmE [Candidatus Pullilachnospira stercoravium]|uniref:tRNA modification GTPase MnmE n=1 Tax=Candidatus Pullilachnospira stercoravium TaxID=2840913 RepID=A0A9D1NT51_9FIRM|nr:tRNA uridine-5-carboxymethylaminomethyl(34) synthesis GTPase MnmE [Candidatus Pullilachnospira stercoravium]
MSEDTIAAISTAMSPSGIGIVRISGAGAVRTAGKIYRSPGGKKRLEDVPSHTIHYGYIYDGDLMADEVLVMVMRGPRSYTGEDTVEINCHGGLLAVRRVLEAVLHAGARMAEPGEFTKRAFLNGRIDLSQAEAVMDVINAGSEYALDSSLSQLKGSVMRSVRKIREEILYEIAFIESALDDPEHISLEGYPERLEEKTAQEKERIERLIRSFSEGKMIREGIRTVIVGKPNAGKSSLMNMLVGEEKAIVTDVAGTTRDVLEEQVMLEGISLRMMDTAGIRETSDLVEQIGVERARKYAREADLILYVVDASVPLDENDREILEIIRDRKTIVLLNKSDLPQVLSPGDLEQMGTWPVLSISAGNRQGVEILEAQIRKMFFAGELEFNDQVYITNARHKNALEKARDSLEMVENSIAAGMPEDFFSIDLMDAYEALGTILGESVGEDLVNEIFSKFCTGK